MLRLVLRTNCVCMVKSLRKFIHFVLALAFAGVSYYGATHGLDLRYPLAAAAGVLFISFLVARSMHSFERLRMVHARSAGDLYFALGVGVSVFLYVPEQQHAFLASMLVLGCADTGAALVGGLWGIHEYRVLGELRTWEGSCAAFFISAALLWLFGIDVPMALLGGVLLAVVEAVAHRGSDNFFLPVLTGAYVLFTL